MDKAIVERAVQALAALNSFDGHGSDSVLMRGSRPVAATHAVTEGDEEKPACGSPQCAGCYEVEPGVRIHPPKCGDDYRKLLERWEAKGRTQ